MILPNQNSEFLRRILFDLVLTPIVGEIMGKKKETQEGMQKAFDTSQMTGDTGLLQNMMARNPGIAKRFTDVTGYSPVQPLGSAPTLGEVSPGTSLLGGLGDIPLPQPNPAPLPTTQEGLMTRALFEEGRGQPGAPQNFMQGSASLGSALGAAPQVPGEGVLDRVLAPQRIDTLTKLGGMPAGPLREVAYNAARSSGLLPKGAPQAAPLAGLKPADIEGAMTYINMFDITPQQGFTSVQQGTGPDSSWKIRDIPLDDASRLKAQKELAGIAHANALDQIRTEFGNRKQLAQMDIDANKELWGIRLSAEGSKVDAGDWKIATDLAVAYGQPPLVALKALKSGQITDWTPYINYLRVNKATEQLATVIDKAKATGDKDTMQQAMKQLAGMYGYQKQPGWIAKMFGAKGEPAPTGFSPIGGGAPQPGAASSSVQDQGDAIVDEALGTAPATQTGGAPPATPETPGATKTQVPPPEYVEGLPGAPAALPGGTPTWPGGEPTLPEQTPYLRSGGTSILKKGQGSTETRDFFGPAGLFKAYSEIRKSLLKKKK